MHVVHWILLILAWFFLVMGIVALGIPKGTVLISLRNVAIAIVLFLICQYLIL